jgi:Zn-dependent membrane protease YugP
MGGARPSDPTDDKAHTEMMTYLLFMLPMLVLSLWASARVKGTFRKYNQVPLRSGVSGAEAAAMILRGAGIHDVSIAAVPGMLSDHYDPTRKVVALSNEILNGRTAAAVAVAAHEVGHAIQHAQAYAPMSVRASLVPLANIGSQLGIPMLIFGAILHMPGLAWAGVIAFTFAVLFHVVTLPVEFDASRRAIQILERSGIVAGDEMPGVRKTLFAAGFTYVAATLVAIVELVYWLIQSGLLGSRSEE